jgi:hypothetical protein
VPAIEVLVVNSVASDALAEGKFDRLEQVMRDGEYYDMQTFDQSVLALYRRGLVDQEAALQHATSAPALRVELEQVDRERNGGGAPVGPVPGAHRADGAAAPFAYPPPTAPRVPAPSTNG